MKPILFQVPRFQLKERKEVPKVSTDETKNLNLIQNLKLIK